MDIKFSPGDKVKVRHLRSPVMWVINPNSDDKNKDVKFEGIRCRWFTTEDKLCEAIFHTKDLEKL